MQQRNIAIVQLFELIKTMVPSQNSLDSIFCYSLDGDGIRICNCFFEGM